MKTYTKIIAIILFGLFVACGGNEEKKEKVQIRMVEQPKTGNKIEPEKQANVETSADDDLANKGIGPIKAVEVGATIDANMATKGEGVFNNLCMACHKMDKKFVGPALAGVSQRRSPEWIMNMILNPEEMVKNDPIAKRLLIENNMAMMANQNVPEEDARAVLEYFRQFDSTNKK